MHKMILQEVDVEERIRGGRGDLRRANLAVARSELIAGIADAMTTGCLSQVQAAKLCGTDQPTLSKVLRGRIESVSLEKLFGWLLALGRSVQVRVSRTEPGHKGKLTVDVDGRFRHD
jgi:predicted XRE-type DNA-binding protein